MSISNFMFDWPVLIKVLLQFWIGFGVFILLLFYLDKPFNRTNVVQWLSRSFFFSLGVWLLMLFMVMLHMTLQGITS